MPELPEAETIARVLNEHLRGKSLNGRGVLEKVWRSGKSVIFDFNRQRMIAKLGMTGTFRLNTPPGPYTRATFDFGTDQLLYNDIRKFGRLLWINTPMPLPPDVLAMSTGEFAEQLAKRNRPIKALLLDQSIASGVGNIYADECLFAAKIHPLTPAHQVNGRKLHASILEVLNEAIAAGGSTISDFFDPFGNPGRYQNIHRTYGREGMPCPECGTPIVRDVVAQRGTHYCPRCQPATPPSRRQRRAQRP